MYKYKLQILFYVLASVLLTACGGSSDPGGASPGPAPRNLTITITTVAASIPANTIDFPILLESPYFTQVNVQVTFDNGVAIPDGTNIQFSTSNVQVAPISTLDDPATTNINEFTTLFGNVGIESAGGMGTFFVHGVAPGNVSLTASAVDPQTGRTSSRTTQFTVNPGPEPFERLAIEAVATTLPSNVFGFTPREAIGTVYMTEATISFRDPLGNFANPGVDGAGDSTVGVSINPVFVAAFSTLDDPETQDDGDPLTEENEVFILLGQGPVDMVAGKGTIFIWSGQQGVATITITANDPFTGQTISTQLEVVVNSSGNDLPDSIAVLGSGEPIYVNGSGGNQSTTVQVNVSDSELPIIDPNGFNNVEINITTDGTSSGELISGVNVNGLNVQGTSIRLGTSNGVASLLLQSGTNPNTVILTAIADRADNNVDNGIQDPISAQNNFVISDGVLFALDITSPNISNLFLNGVDDGVNIEGGIGSIDGSYSITISAIGTDKGGNPALPQTVQFGLIDSPITGFPSMGSGTFAISGSDGDPVEGGAIFRANNGAFVTAAGGAQPADTLLVFAEDSLGNEDLESAVTVQNVNSETSLNIVERFNRNDLTGSINNDFGILDYIIGRAVDGNINATAVIDDNGVASTQLNYPSSKLGKIAGIYAKGQGAVTNGVVRTVTDVELLVYPGVGSIGDTGLVATLTASPQIIPPNRSSMITVCTQDAASAPLQGRLIQWSYTGGNGNGSIDGISGSGAMVNRTGVDGCAVGVASTTGVTIDNSDSGFSFFSGSLSCAGESGEVCIRVASPGTLVLNAVPSAFSSSGAKFIALTLYGGDGSPVEGAAISGQCESDGGGLSITSGPSVTDINGVSNVSVFSALNGIEEFFSGTCTFSVAGGDPSVTVSFIGQDECVAGVVSPVPPAACPPP